MLNRLQKYDVRMIYTQGKYMFTADTLSRAVDKEEPADSEKRVEIQAYVDMVVTSLHVTEDRTEPHRPYYKVGTDLFDCDGKIKQISYQLSKDCFCQTRRPV